MTDSVVIVGAGVMGMATACFLARDHGVSVTLLERDVRYQQASSALSASSIRVQFATPVNIALSRWSLAFLRNLGQELAVDGDRPDIGLTEPGYLYLAQADTAKRLRQIHAVQTRHGAEVALLEPAALAQRFPWMQVEDLALGALGISTAQSGEGWFDGPALHQALWRKARSLGVKRVQADIRGWDVADRQVVAAVDAQGQRWPGSAFVLAAGAWSAPLALGLGWDLPVSPRKRDVFVLEAPVRLKDAPLLIDPSGVWCRPEGTGYLAGAPPREPWPGDEPDAPLNAIDHGLFEDHIWPILAQRIPAFEALRVRSAWAGYYEMNAFDHNGLAGAFPDWDNAYTACGFSGHGMQHAPAVGSALALQIAQRQGCASTLPLSPNGEDSPVSRLPPDISALSPQRLRSGQPLLETQVI